METSCGPQRWTVCPRHGQRDHGANFLWSNWKSSSSLIFAIDGLWSFGQDIQPPHLEIGVSSSYSLTKKINSSDWMEMKIYLRFQANLWVQNVSVRGLWLFLSLAYGYYGCPQCHFLPLWKQALKPLGVMTFLSHFSGQKCVFSIIKVYVVRVRNVRRKAGHQLCTTLSSLLPLSELHFLCGYISYIYRPLA